MHPLVYYFFFLLSVGRTCYVIVKPVYTFCFSERKLKQLGRKKLSSNKELLESLEERKNDAVLRLLSEDNSFGEVFTEEDIPTKWLKSYINPEQPLTVGELLSLVKEDYLAKSSEELEEGKFMFYMLLT